MTTPATTTAAGAAKAAAALAMHAAQELIRLAGGDIQARTALRAAEHAAYAASSAAACAIAAITAEQEHRRLEQAEPNSLAGANARRQLIVSACLAARHAEIAGQQMQAAQRNLGAAIPSSSLARNILRAQQAAEQAHAAANAIGWRAEAAGEPAEREPAKVSR